MLLPPLLEGTLMDLLKKAHLLQFYSRIPRDIPHTSWQASSLKE